MGFGSVQPEKEEEEAKAHQYQRHLRYCHPLSARTTSTRRRRRRRVLLHKTTAVAASSPATSAPATFCISQSVQKGNEQSQKSSLRLESTSSTPTTSTIHVAKTKELECYFPGGATNSAATTTANTFATESFCRQWQAAIAHEDEQLFIRGECEQRLPEPVNSWGAASTAV